jgi:hypothetical protein
MPRRRVLGTRQITFQMETTLIATTTITPEPQFQSPPEISREASIPVREILKGAQVLFAQNKLILVRARRGVRGVRALSPGGKKMLTDYFNAVIQNFGNMKQVMGSVGRNQMQLQAEINSVPLPYLDTQTADTAFADKFQDLKMRNRSLPTFFGQQPGQGGQSGGRRVIDLR